MAARHTASQPESPDIRQEVMTAVGRGLLREFNVAFALMSLIPLGIGVYVVAARLFTIQIFEGLTGLYFLIALIFALLGFLVGRRILRGVLTKLIDTSVQLRQHEVVKTAFIGNVAYELRPPLAAAHMSLKNLVDGLFGPLTDGQTKTAQECFRIVGRLVHMVTDLIDVTGGGRDASPLQREVFDLQAAIRDAVQAAEPSAAARHLSLTLALPEQPALFYGDRARFLQAFGSLLDHAARWSPEGGAIDVTLSSALEEWRFVVAHPLVPGPADSFFGLGLHLAKSIIELHHGRFWTEGHGGRSSRLIICLPVLESPHPAASAASRR